MRSFVRTHLLMVRHFVVTHFFLFAPFVRTFPVVILATRLSSVVPFIYLSPSLSGPIKHAHTLVIGIPFGINNLVSGNDGASSGR